MSYMGVGDKLTVKDLAETLTSGKVVAAYGFNATHKVLLRIETDDGGYIEVIVETYRDVAADALESRDEELVKLDERLAESVEYRLRGDQYQDMWTTFHPRNEIATMREP